MAQYAMSRKSKNNLLVRPLLFALAMASVPALAASALEEARALPHLDAQGQAGYRTFLAQPDHRAFVIAPGGGWAWRAGMSSAAAAREAALADCATQNAICAPYAVDRKIVFDAKIWPTLWRPYLSADKAGRAREGLLRGLRFPDLRLQTADGKAVKLSDWRGEVVVLHFWGSWCPPCRRELPDLHRLQQRLKTSKGIRLVTIQMREPVSCARRWLRDRQLSLPLYDSGAVDEGGFSMRLGDGRTLSDRILAPVFPSTYVVDRHGIVVFAHAGPLHQWPQYLDFLRDVEKLSGQ
jgi:thiol-disulfide isomerase/thioredoxin